MKKIGKDIALIIASGVGARMGQSIPKHFLNVFDKPVIVYTMECFQNHPEIDGIVVVCLDGWHEILNAYAKQFGITKLVSVVSGGETGFESIVKGTKEVERYILMKKLLFDIPNEMPSIGNPMQCGFLNSKKLMNLGWTPQFDKEKGFENTFKVLKEI